MRATPQLRAPILHERDINRHLDTVEVTGSIPVSPTILTCMDGRFPSFVPDTCQTLVGAQLSALYPEIVSRAQGGPSPQQRKGSATRPLSLRRVPECGAVPRLGGRRVVSLSAKPIRYLDPLCLLCTNGEDDPPCAIADSWPRGALDAGPGAEAVAAVRGPERAWGEGGSCRTWAPST